MKRIPNAVPDAPVYRATLQEMENLPELLAVAGELAVKHGAVRIDPPPEWEPPLLRMARNSKFFVREQTLPEAPFVDLTPLNIETVKKRRRRVIDASDDEEERGAEGAKSKQEDNTAVVSAGNGDKALHTKPCSVQSAAAQDVPVIPPKQSCVPNPVSDGHGNGQGSTTQLETTEPCVEKNPEAPRDENGKEKRASHQMKMPCPGNSDNPTISSSAQVPGLTLGTATTSLLPMTGNEGMPATTGATQAMQDERRLDSMDISHAMVRNPVYTSMFPQGPAPCTESVAAGNFVAWQSQQGSQVQSQAVRNTTTGAAQTLGDGDNHGNFSRGTSQPSHQEGPVIQMTGPGAEGRLQTNASLPQSRANETLHMQSDSIRPNSFDASLPKQHAGREELSGFNQAPTSFVRIRDDQVPQTAPIVQNQQWLPRVFPSQQGPTPVPIAPRPVGASSVKSPKQIVYSRSMFQWSEAPQRLAPPPASSPSMFPAPPVRNNLAQPAQPTVINDLGPYAVNPGFQTELTRIPPASNVPVTSSVAHNLHFNNMQGPLPKPDVPEGQPIGHQPNSSVPLSTMAVSNLTATESDAQVADKSKLVNTRHCFSQEVRGSIGSLLNHDRAEEAITVRNNSKPSGMSGQQKPTTSQAVHHGHSAAHGNPPVHIGRDDLSGPDLQHTRPAPIPTAPGPTLTTQAGKEGPHAQMTSCAQLSVSNNKDISNGESKVALTDLAQQLAVATQESSNEQLKASGNMDLMWLPHAQDPGRKRQEHENDPSVVLQPDVIPEHVPQKPLKHEVVASVDGSAVKQSAEVNMDLKGHAGDVVKTELDKEKAQEAKDLNSSRKLVAAAQIADQKTIHVEKGTVGDDLPRTGAQKHQSQDVKEESREICPNKEVPHDKDKEEADETKTAPKVELSRSGLRQKAKRQRPRVGSRKRAQSVGMMLWDQDKSGRLTVPIVFPDSPQTVSLNIYEKKSMSYQEELRALLLEDANLDLYDLEDARQRENKDWLRDVDVLEKIFWTSLKKGVNGRPITVSYGVDVEAEGAFDSIGKGYVEWYGVDNSGRMVKKNKKEPQKLEPEVKDEPEEANVLSSTQQDNGVVETEVLVDEGNGTDAQVQSENSSPTGPKSHVGNLNRNGLLRHMPRMPGINHSMYYVGQLFTRFCWHVEDAFLNSVSYLHHGSAEKVWYAIPPKHAPAFDAYASKHVFAEELVEEYGSGQALLMNKTTIFDPRDLRGTGIDVFRVVHKPGTFVLTAPRGYHAGFNCGFNVAEAVNFALAPWFPVGREASRFAREIQKPLCVPWEYLLFHEAKAIRDGAKSHRKPSKRLIQNARILCSELQALITRGEHKIREYAARRNCRVTMLSEIDVLVKNNQLGPEFGHGAGMVCSLCGHACHFYAEVCASCDNSFEARCEQHFGQGPKLCTVRGHKTILVRRHDPVLLADVLTTLEEIAGIQRSKEEMLSRYTSYLRSWETPMRSSGLRLRLNLKLAASRLPPNLASAKPAKDVGRKEKRRGRKRSEVSRRKDYESDEERAPKRRRRRGDGARKSALVISGNDRAKVLHKKVLDQAAANAKLEATLVEVPPVSLTKSLPQGNSATHQEASKVNFVEVSGKKSIL